MPSIDTGPIIDRIQDLNKEVCNLLEVADKLSEIEKGEFIVAKDKETDRRDPGSVEVYRALFEAYVGYIEGGVTSLGGGRFVIDLEKPAAVRPGKALVDVEGEGEYGLVNGRKWAAEMYLPSGKKTTEEVADKVVSHVFFPPVEAEIYKGQDAEELLQVVYGLSPEDYEQLFDD